MDLKKSLNWIKIRGRHTHEGFAFIIHRVTGLIVLIYLIVHLGALTQIITGHYSSFLSTVESPPFIALDILLFLAIIYHGMNGIRLIFSELGIGTKKNKLFFYVMMGIGIVIWIAAAYIVATGGL